MGRLSDAQISEMARRMAWAALPPGVEMSIEPVNELEDVLFRWLKDRPEQRLCEWFVCFQGEASPLAV